MKRCLLLENQSLNDNGPGVLLTLVCLKYFLYTLVLNCIRNYTSILDGINRFTEQANMKLLLTTDDLYYPLSLLTCGLFLSVY